MLFAFVASTVLVIFPTINPIGHASLQQYVFAQENTIESSYNKTITNTTFYPQIHNYTSPPPGQVSRILDNMISGFPSLIKSVFANYQYFSQKVILLYMLLQPDFLSFVTMF